jgi:hypothetical protein
MMRAGKKRAVVRCTDMRPGGLRPLSAALAVLAGVALGAAEANAESFEHLQYTPPAGWTAQVVQEGRAYLYQDATASGAVTLFNSRPTQLAPAAVFAEEWRARLGPVVGVQAPAPELTHDGDVTAATGVVSATLQGNQVMALLATFVGRGRALTVVAIASGDGPRQVSAFVGTFGIAAAAAPAAKQAEAPPSRDKRRPVPGGKLAGLYLSQAYEYTYRPDVTGRTSGSSGMAMTTSFYLLSEDGRVARGSGLPEAPDGDIRRFDFDGYQRRNPAASGTYKVESGRVILQMGAGTSVAETVVAPVSEDGQLEIKKKKYKRSIKAR